MLGTMMYKRREKKIRHYAPIRVVDPTSSLHTAQILPRQGINLVLGNPCLSRRKCSPKAEFQVEINSDFLIIEKITETKNGKRIYHIGQKYDLENWSHHSVVYLGEVIVSITNYDIPEPPSKICVNLLGSLEPNDPIRRVLTVINPNGHECKLEPNQILEVITCEPSWNDWDSGKVESSGFKDKWGDVCRPLKSDLPDVHLLKTRQITICREDVEVDGYIARNRYTLSVNPQLSPDTKKVVKDFLDTFKQPCRQHHFFYSIPKDSEKKLSNLEKGTYLFHRLEMQGECDQIGNEEVGKVERRSLIVNLAVTGHNKKTPKAFNVIDPKERKVDKVRRIVRNPEKQHNVDFYPSKEDYLIELPSPQVLFPNLSSEVKWQTKVEPNHSSQCFVKLTSVSDIHQGEFRFNRWMISASDWRPMDKNDTKFLGSASFWIPGYDKETMARLSCWIKPEIETPYVNPSASRAIVPSSWRRQEKSNVMIEELDDESLETGTSWVRLSEVRRTATKFYPQTPYSPYPPYQKKTITHTDFAQPISNNASKTACHKPAAFVVYNLAHQTTVELKYGQKLVVKMQAPSVILGKDRCKGELWNAGFVPSNNLALSIDKNVTFGIGNLCFQEITISADTTSTHIKNNDGDNHVGTLLLSCSEEKRAIRIFMEMPVDRPITPTTPLPVFKVVKPDHCDEANGENYNFLSAWNHNNAIEVMPSETTIVKMPIVNSDMWRDDKWTIDFKQTAIPEDAWRLLPESLRKGINCESPWYKKYPVLLNNGVCFKPIDQPNVDKILEAIVDTGVQKRFLIGTLTFKTTSKKNRHIATGSGTFSTVINIERTIGVYVTLPQQVKKPYNIVENPIDNKELPVNPGQEFKITLSPQLVELNSREGYVQAKWYLLNYPAFLDYVGENEKDSTWVFMVKKNQAPRRDYLHFTTIGKMSRKFVLDYNEKCSC